MKHLEYAFAFFPLFFGLLGTTSSGQTSKQSFAGMRLLPDYEADVYGPLVFPDEVQKFLDFEIDYLRKRQNASIQVTLNGKSYIQWSGPISSLRPDRYWRLRDSKAIGIGGYNSRIVFHQLQISVFKAK